MADSQSKQVQIDNMRIVKVNAQVTAMISFSEIVGFVIISLLSVTANSVTVGDILFPVLQNIILPYAFLLNTRDNKYRIVEQGWTIFLRNALNINYLCSVWPTSGRVKPFKSQKNEEDIEIYVVSTKANRLLGIIANPSSRSKNLVVNCNINVPLNYKPSGSKKQYSIDSHDKNAPNLIRPSSSSSDESYSDESLNLSYRKELLDELLKNVNQETVYLLNFTRLVILEQNHTLEKRDLETSIAIHEDLIINKASKLLINGERQQRVNRRKDFIETLLIYFCDESKYKETFDAFVNMEEQFLEETD